MKDYKENALAKEIYKRKYSLLTFCEKAGINRRTLYYILNKRNVPSGQTIGKLADALEMDFDDVARLCKG